MGAWARATSGSSGVIIPAAAIGRLRLVFPAERILNRSRGIDRDQPIPARHYDTPAGRWSTDEPALLRLLHNDWPFVIENIARVPADAEFVAASTNYGSNPYYCIRWARQQSDGDPGGLFHLEQECLDEPHYGAIVRGSDGTALDVAPVRFHADGRAWNATTHEELAPEALVFTAPAIVWDRRFVGWEAYARSTYDCRHIVNLQYTAHPRECEAVAQRIGRLQRLWPDRDAYASEVLRIADEVGFGEYERLMVGVGGSPESRFLLLASVRGTAEEVARQLLEDYPDLEAAFQIAEGGGTGILMGTPADSRVIGPSSYRRGRVLCALLVELRGASCQLRP
jgi:hypothetical protein